MTRLPGLDRRTRRAESIVHLVLGLAALALIGLATLNGFQFAGNLDGIAANLSGGQTFVGGTNSQDVQPGIAGPCLQPCGPAGRTAPRTSRAAPNN